MKSGMKLQMMYNHVIQAYIIMQRMWRTEGVKYTWRTGGLEPLQTAGNEAQGVFNFLIEILFCHTFQFLKQTPVFPKDIFKIQ